MEKVKMQNSLVKERVSADLFSSDSHFDKLYPLSIQKLSERHWTPLAVARKAAQFLAVEKNARILDIGSGAGKFCIIAAHFHPNALFCGVEQRTSLIDHANKVKDTLHLENVSFRHGNFTQLNFGDYDNFYFYNSFFENLSVSNQIDDSIDYSAELFLYYHNYMYRQLEKRPTGTRLVTFHTLGDEVPRCYQLVGKESDILLKFWIRK